MRTDVLSDPEATAALSRPRTSWRAPFTPPAVLAQHLMRSCGTRARRTRAKLLAVARIDRRTSADHTVQVGVSHGTSCRTPNFAHIQSVPESCIESCICVIHPAHAAHREHTVAHTVAHAERASGRRRRHRLFYRRHSHIMQYCLGCDSKRVFAACKHGDAERLRELLENGAEPSSEMRSSEHLEAPDKTPLLVSVMQGHADCVQLLIDAGALLDVQCGPDLETALHVCCARGKPGLAQQLIAGGANLCKPDSIGRHAGQRLEP